MTFKIPYFMPNLYLDDILLLLFFFLSSLISVIGFEQNQKQNHLNQRQLIIGFVHYDEKKTP